SAEVWRVEIGKGIPHAQLVLGRRTQGLDRTGSVIRPQPQSPVDDWQGVVLKERVRRKLPVERVRGSLGSVELPGTGLRERQHLWRLGVGVRGTRGDGKRKRNARLCSHQVKAQLVGRGGLTLLREQPRGLRE